MHLNVPGEEGGQLVRKAQVGIHITLSARPSDDRSVDAVSTSEQTSKGHRADDQ